MVVICPAGPFASLAVLSGWIPGQAGWMCFLAVLDILAGYNSYIKFECCLCWLVIPPRLACHSLFAGCLCSLCWILWLALLNILAAYASWLRCLATLNMLAGCSVYVGWQAKLDMLDGYVGHAS